MFYRLFIIFALSILSVNSQEINTNHTPKLVVGIVVDQMRYDYLTRFYNQFGEGGFKKIITKGFNCKNHHINYIPTTTAPGHASIYTGTTPKNHGIVGNSWYDKTEAKKVYCVNDLSVSPVGTSSYEGKKSPSKMQVTTVADQNRLYTQMRGKTISIALKDRAAVLSGGHTANASYWLRGKNQGSWISSTYYMKKLPKWVINFNESNKVDSYLKNWNTLYDINTYTESGKDNTKYERGFKGKEKPVFPYDLKQLKELNGEYDIIKYTPYGNSLTVDFAIAAIKGEHLGKDNSTDFLNISFSSTDYIGHNFGVNSKEIQDTYLRLDKDIERLINNLDILVGNNSYLLFLTSDHGATQVPKFLKSIKIPGGYFKEASEHIAIKNHIYNHFKIDSLIEHISNNQIFLNNTIIKKQELDRYQIQNEVAKYLLHIKEINSVYTRTQLLNGNYTSGIASLLQKGFHHKRSGDIFYSLTPYTIAYSETGSTHGSGYTYDTHIPLLFYGAGISKGSTRRKTTIIDIAPTVSALIQISLPNAATGTIINEVIH